MKQSLRKKDLREKSPEELRTELRADRARTRAFQIEPMYTESAPASTAARREAGLPAGANVAVCERGRSGVRDVPASGVSPTTA